jgi:hypothetical protein
MSVASINNGSLQLSELIVSNEKYSNSAGYAPSTASFSAGLTGTNVTIGNILADKVTINSSNTANDYSLTSYSNALSISCPNSITPLIQFGNSNDYVQLSCPADNTLQLPTLQLSNSSGVVQIKPITTDYIGLVNTSTGLNTASVQGGTFNALTSVTTPTLNLAASNGANTNITYDGTGINFSEGIIAPTYSGGIGMLRTNLSVPQILPNSSATLIAVISNFIGSANSAYVISCNTIAPIIFDVDFFQVAEPDTTIYIYAVNPTQATLEASNVQISIIAMN